MNRLYFALVGNTPDLFAVIIKKVINIEYIHVVLSLDADLTQAYSVGRRNLHVPIIAGFIRENKEKVLKRYPNAIYRIISIPCTKEQKNKLQKELEDCHKHRFHYHYCIVGLPFIILNKPFYQKNHYTCASFIADILQKNGIHLFNKHFSLVTPLDFYQLADAKIEFDGKLCDFMKRKQHLANEMLIL